MKNNDLIQSVKQSWSESFSDHFSCEIALSGGLDSVVLLHILCQLRGCLKLSLSAVHVHHGLQNAADEWADFCRQLCAQWQVDFRLERVKIDPQSPLGIEGAAREARYRVFSGSLKPIIALAHHADDQIETFFLSLLRGGGVRGMACMPVLRENDSGHILWRPLLHATKKELSDYANSQQLKYVEDPSNQDQHYLRNWLRQSILPQITERLPELSAHIRHNIADCQETLTQADEMRDYDWQHVSNSDFLICHEWAKRRAGRRKALLYYFAKYHQLGTPRFASISDFAQQLFNNPHAPCVWQLPQGQAHAYAGKLWAWADNNHLKQRIKQNQAWQMSDLTWANNRLPENNQSTISHIRTVEKKDRLSIEIGRKSVLKILQEHKIPHFIRHYWPVLLNQKGECIGIVGIRMAAHLPKEQLPNALLLKPYLRLPETSQAQTKSREHSK